MSSELFVELSDEQQELVSGGASFDLNKYLTASQYQSVYGTVHGGSMAGPGGSGSGAWIVGGAMNTGTLTYFQGLGISS
jgi:hypothetical protein